MIGATIAEGICADNHARHVSSCAAGGERPSAQELPEALLQERLRESPQDPVPKIGARRAVRAPDAEVDAQESLGPLGERRTHVLRRAAYDGGRDEQREFVGELARLEPNFALAQDL